MLLCVYSHFDWSDTFYPAAQLESLEPSHHVSAMVLKCVCRGWDIADPSDTKKGGMSDPHSRGW